MESRDSFIFYRSFFEAIKNLDSKSKLTILDAIVDYGLNHNEHKLNGVPAIVFTMAKPQLDANWKRYRNGCKGKDYGSLGGAPKGNTNASKQPQNNPTGVKKTTPNNNDNENENINENYNDNNNANENENGNENVDYNKMAQDYVARNPEVRKLMEKYM